MNTEGLTRDDLKAIRSADHWVSFHYAAEHDMHESYRPEDRPPDTTLRLVKRHDPGDGFGQRELTVEIPCETASFTIYETGYDNPGPLRNAYWPISSPFHCPEWATVTKLLKVGDRIRPHWRAGNNSDMTREVGITIDEFYLYVHRRKGKGEDQELLTFLLGVCPIKPHSAGRNIKWRNSA